MQTHDNNSLAAMENRAVALLGRLHVVLQRENGFVADLECMRSDPGYFRQVLELALHTGNRDMKAICDQLAHLFFDPDGLFNRGGEMLVPASLPPRTRPGGVLPL